MPIYKNFEQGDRLTADWVRMVNDQLKKLNRMRGRGGIEVHNSPAGITIGADIKQTADRRLAIARREGDTGATGWPDFKDWTEGDGTSNQQQTIFDFEFVEPTSFYDDELDRPNYYYPYQGTGEFVRALNITEHYVPHYLGYGGYVQWLTKSGGKWFAEYKLPPVLRVLMNEDLYPDGRASCHATNYELGNPEFYVYDSGFIPQTKKWSAGAVGMAELRRVYHNLMTSPIWRYEIYEVFGCPVFSDGPEEE